MTKNKRLVESFEEFTSKLESGNQVTELGDKIISNLAGIYSAINKHGGEEIRFIFNDGSYLYFIFVKKLNPMDIKNSMLRVFNFRGDGFVAQEFMEGIRSLMREETNYLYDVVQYVMDSNGGVVSPVGEWGLYNPTDRKQFESFEPIGLSDESEEEYEDEEDEQEVLDKRLTDIADDITKDVLRFPLDRNGDRVYGERKRRGGLILKFTPLFWNRNMIDGWEIDVYEIDRMKGREYHIGSIEVDGNKQEINIDDEFYKRFRHNNII
jgi:hypothetical protein